MQVTGASSYSYLQQMQQMQQMQQALFNKADGNGGGSLSIDQFEAAGQGNSAGSANSADPSRAAALFKTIDSNGDGQVSQDELNSYATRLSSDNQAQMLQFQQQLFNKADTNGDGSLSLVEFESPPAGGSAQSASDSKAADLFKKIDTNGDGKVSQDELTSFMSANKPQGAGGAHGHHHHAHGAGGGDAKSLADLLSGPSDTSTSTDTGTAAVDPLSPASTTPTADSAAAGTPADFGKQIAAYLQQMLSGYADQTQNSTSGVNLFA